MQQEAMQQTAITAPSISRMALLERAGTQVNVPRARHSAA